MKRRLSESEKRLLRKIINSAQNIDFEEKEIEYLMVEPMEDGGMGSLKLIPPGCENEKRIFGKQIAEFQFNDIDDIKVIASLNVDQNGHLFELDIWKTNFSKLIKYPF